MSTIPELVVTRSRIGQALIGVVLCAASLVQAQVVAIDFEALAASGPGSSTLANGYQTDGFVFTTNIDPLFAEDALGVWNTGDANFNGSTAMFNTYLFDIVNGGALTLARADGTPFALTSIDLGQLFVDSGSSTEVPFVGVTAEGGSVSVTFTLPPVLTPATFTFPGSFVDLVSVRWEQLPQYHQFDNLVLVTAAVPEPATAWLLALGCSVLLLLNLGQRQRVADSRTSLSPMPASASTPATSTAHNDQRR